LYDANFLLFLNDGFFIFDEIFREGNFGDGDLFVVFGLLLGL
jgi:hypothetical protein